MLDIWTDPDWLALSANGKVVYLQLISQPDISKAGVLPMVPPRWASAYPDKSVEQVNEALAELEQADFIHIDNGTAELLVRTYMRYDEMYLNPNGRPSIEWAIEQILSPAIKQAVQDDFAALSDTPSDTPSGTASDTPSDTPSATPSDTASATTRTRTSTRDKNENESGVVVHSSDEFEFWWALYPKKVSKKAAERAWRKMSQADRDAAMKAIPEHAAIWNHPNWNPQYTPYPATWLNGEKWNDDLEPLRRTVNRPTAGRQAPGMETVRRLMEEARNGS